MSPTTAAVFSSSVALLLLAILYPSVSLADKEAFYDSTKYNNAEYGNYVTQDFISSNVSAPWLNFIRPFSACDDGSYYFVAPRGNVADATPYILDVDGSLVWAPDEHYGEVYNFQVQTYKGEQYLTYWSGDDSIGGHGEGTYHMLDRHYEEFRRVEGANGRGADLHSFTITAGGTAVCSLYDIHEVDLIDVRPEEPIGYIWDSLFQEIDIETGEALFEWRASEHFNLTEAYTRVTAATMENPWDFFHINAVDKDHLGNYLVSSRFLRTIAYIDGRDGHVLWQLGGKRNSFSDLSGGLATSIVGQHDARWTADHSAVTFFDNRGDWYYQSDFESWGSRVRLDLDRMTAKVEQLYKNPAAIYSFSQGSYQTLPNGNVMIGWGFNGVFTEFSADGEVLCDAYMQPRRRFGSGDVQSYRNMKFNWTGIPKTQPSLVYHQHALYMSWKGSTETRRWLLQDADRRDVASADYEPVLAVAKNGFETRVPVDSGLCTRSWVRVVALDAQGQHLAVSQPILLNLTAGACNGEWRDSAGAGVGSAGYATSDTSSFSAVTYTHPSANAATFISTTHSDLARQVKDLQLLLGFGVLALLSSLLVAWFLFGMRIGISAPPLRASSHSASSSTSSNSSNSSMWGKSRFSPGKELWSRVRGFLPSEKRWWDGDDEEDETRMGNASARRTYGASRDGDEDGLEREDEDRVAMMKNVDFAEGRKWGV